MAVKSRWRSAIEYGAVRAVLGVLRRLPRRLAWSVTDRLGDLANLVDHRHRDVARRNLALVFGGAPNDPAHRRTVRRVFRHFLRVGAEFAMLPDLLRSRGLEGIVDIHGKEHVAAALGLGRGVIVFTGHVGNWEVVAAAGEPLGMRLHCVGRRMDNPLLDAYLTRHRMRYVRSVIPKEGGLPRIVRALRAGDCVAMLLDQHAGRQGLVVDFMGQPASTFRAPAELAVRFGVPLLGGFGIRVDDAPRFRLDFERPLIPDPDADPATEVRRLTQAVSDALAARVRAHPEQWNWLHRRWRAKMAEPGAPRAAQHGMEASA